MRVSTSILVLGLALLLGYLFYTPVPEGMVDKLQYRLLTAGVKAVTLISTLCTYIQSGDHVYYQTFGIVSDMLLPAADSQVRGSNVEAHYADFDGVKVLVYTPVTERIRRGFTPGLVYYHGGGFGIGSTKSHGPLTRYLAEQLDMVVISVEYRLAPTNPFPAAIEDSFKATKWFLNHAHQYGVDADRVVVSGDSAGGFLTAVIVQLVHDDATLPDIKLQVLYYPWTQCFDFKTPSHQQYEVDFGESGMVSKPRVAEFLSTFLFGRFDESFMRQARKNEHVSDAFRQSGRYQSVLDHAIVSQQLGMSSTSATSQQETLQRGNDTLWEEIEDRLLDPRFAPLFRKDFKGLPAAFIATADLDSLRDDGIFYARLLAEAGVKVTWKNYLGAYHGIVASGPIRSIPTGVQIVDDSVKFIQDNV